MSKHLSADKLAFMANVATDHEQQQSAPLYKSVLRGTLAASIIGLIALASTQYSAAPLESSDDIFELVIYESLEADFF